MPLEEDAHRAEARRRRHPLSLGPQRAVAQDGEGGGLEGLVLVAQLLAWLGFGLGLRLGLRVEFGLGFGLGLGSGWR